jgi:hypothetical protein
MKYFPLAVVKNQAQRRLFTFFSVVLLTISCIPSNNEVLNEIKYFRDNRTGLCFAAQALGFNQAVMSNVPCTPGVERLIQGAAQ